MNLSQIALVELLRFALQEWAIRRGKGVDWIPTEDDWRLLTSDVNKTLEQYEAEARIRLGLPPV